MPSTTAVLRIRPRLPATLSANRRTTASIDLVIRLVGGLYSSSAVKSQTNLSNLKAWLPSARVPVTNLTDGTMTPEWYRFIQYVVETVLGGAIAPTVADVVVAQASVTASSITATQTATAISQQADANAQALAAAVQVVQSASLAGANNIPPVQLNSRMAQR